MPKIQKFNEKGSEANHKSKDENKRARKAEALFKEGGPLPTNPPAYLKLSAAGKREWRRIAMMSAESDRPFLTEADIATLGAYCSASAQIVFINSELKKYSPGDLDAKETDGYLKLTAQLAKQSSVLASLADSLCLSPRGRAKAGKAVAEAMPKNPFFEIFEEAKKA